MSKYCKQTSTGDLRPLATLPLSNFGGIAIYHIDGELITTGFDYGNGVQGLKTTSLHTDINGRFYIIRYQQAYYIDEFLRV